MCSGEFFNWVNSLSYFPKRRIGVEFQPPFPSFASGNSLLCVLVGDRSNGLVHKPVHTLEQGVTRSGTRSNTVLHGWGHGMVWLIIGTIAWAHRMQDKLHMSCAIFVQSIRQQQGYHLTQ